MEDSTLSDENVKTAGTVSSSDSAWTMNDFSQSVVDWAGYINNLLNGYADGYDKAYAEAIKAGKSAQSAELDAIASGIRANQHYAEVNMGRAASAGNIAQQNVFQGLADHYASVADDLQAQNLSTKQAIDSWVDGVKQEASNGLGKYGSSPLGKSIASKMGPIFDAYQMGDAARNQDWNGLGRAASSSLGSALFVAGASILLGALAATFGAVPLAIGMGIVAILGGLAGSALWDTWHDSWERLTGKLFDLAGGIRSDNTYRIV
ncbi:MAG: hypothetical protein K8F30_02280, partial [Taibaiella sp.]|nr:hypothetical protein [Taibaiella sp.]